MIEIKKTENPQEKATYARQILEELTEWFGMEDSREEYIRDAQKFPFWLAELDGKAVGFITLMQTSKAAAEIHCMGVKPAFHHQGIGKLLVDSLEEYAKPLYKYLQVKTVDEGHYASYDKTIKFYESVGFARLEVFPTHWDAHNPCLILVKYLGGEEAI